jgi:CRISPR-associated protein Cmr2
LHVNLSAFSLRVPALGDPETGLLCPFAAERTPPVPSRLEADRGDNPPGYDGYLVYESRLPEVLAECSSTPEEDLERAVKTATLALRKLIDVVGGRPSTYYAVLAADGDRMGAALDELESLDEQRELSRALDDFSASCPRIARDYCGSLVYAGGDDVLALLPLHTALGCAKELHTEFSRKMEPFRGRVRELPTLSVGLGIAHHMEDMADARALARQAEQLAKSYQRGDTRKNALALVVGKRSGPLLKAVGGWADDSPLDRCIDSWCRLLREERIPDRAAFDLERAVRPFEVGNGPPVDPQLVQALVNRCLLRKRAKKGSAELDQEVRTLLARAVEPQAEPIGAVRALSAELQIARLFLEAYELAFGDLELPEATPEIEQGAQP